MNRSRKLTLSILLLGSLILVILGQYDLNRDRLGLGLALYGLGIVLFLDLVGRLESGGWRATWLPWWLREGPNLTRGRRLRLPPSLLHVATLLLAGLVLAGLGWYLASTSAPGRLETGVALTVLVFLGLAVYVDQASLLDSGLIELGWRLAGIPRRSSVPALLAGIAVACGLSALVVIRRHPSSYWGAFGLWVLSFVLFALALVYRDGRSQAKSLVSGQETARWEKVAVAAMLSLGLILRVVALNAIPQNLAGDEASQGMEAVGFLKGTWANMFDLGWYGVPKMSFFWQALWLRLFGQTILGLRLPWAILGTLTVLVFYLVVRRLFGRDLALTSAFLLATYHFHIHFSRLGSNQIADPLFVLSGLYFLVRGFQDRKTLDFALSGGVLGLSLFFYTGARLAPVWMAVVVAVWFLAERGAWRTHRAHILVLVMAFILVAAPMLMVAVERPDEYNARVNQVGIIQSGWLVNEMQKTGRSMSSLLLEQFQRALLSINYYTGRTPWYGATVPFLGFGGSVLFALGLAYGMARLFDRRYFPFVSWFWMTIVLGGALTESPPSSMRLTGLAPALCFFVALGLLKLLELTRRTLNKPARALSLVTMIVVLVMAAKSVHYYFVEYTPLRKYGSLNAEVATVMGFHLNELGPEYTAYFFGAPRMVYRGWSTIPYLAPEVEVRDVDEPLTGPSSFQVPKDKVLFVFLPERQREARLVRNFYPGGKWSEFLDHDGRTLFIAYQLE